MHREKKLRAIRQTLGREQITKGDEIVFICPRCKHRKPKLSVNLVTDRFHCWICEFSGKTLLPLLAQGSEERKDYASELEAVLGKREVPKQQYDVPVLPDEFRSLSNHSRSPYYGQAMEYLASRGITSDDILRFRLGYAEEGEYKHRIIIPSFDRYGELNFFTGRTFYVGPISYKHGNFCKDIIFNEYMIDWTKPVTITEGAFDSIKAGENAVALQGSILNEGSLLFRKIITSDAQVYFAMDTDAFKKQLEIIELFLSYGVESHYVNLFGKKDVGSMTKEEFRLAKDRSELVRSSSDILKLRVRA
jgi:hypothetical protein